jgi:hypothetical protein
MEVIDTLTLMAYETLNIMIICCLHSSIARTMTEVQMFGTV